jgi:hypothetical protein
LWELMPGSHERIKEKAFLALYSPQGATGHPIVLNNCTINIKICQSFELESGAILRVTSEYRLSGWAGRPGACG